MQRESAMFCSEDHDLHDWVRHNRTKFPTLDQIHCIWKNSTFHHRSLVHIQLLMGHIQTLMGSWIMMFMILDSRVAARAGVKKLKVRCPPWKDSYSNPFKDGINAINTINDPFQHERISFVPKTLSNRTLKFMTQVRKGRALFKGSLGIVLAWKRAVNLGLPKH